VTAAREASFAVDVPSVAVAGSTVTATVTALDAQGQILRTFIGDVKLTTDDAQAVLGSVPFRAGSNGVSTGQVTFKTAGGHVLTASDLLQASSRGSKALLVKSGPPAKLALSALPAAVRAGDETALRVSATDAYGNAAADYHGTV